MEYYNSVYLNPSDKYKTEAGYIKDGTVYETLEDLIQTGFIEFCGCGRPEANLLWVLKGLELLHQKTKMYDLANPDWDSYHKESLEHFGCKEAQYFFWYWLDYKGYTEHGGGVPGWLVEDGEELLDLLREYKGSLNDLH